MPAPKKPSGDGDDGRKGRSRRRPTRLNPDVVALVAECVALVDAGARSFAKIAQATKVDAEELSDQIDSFETYTGIQLFVKANKKRKAELVDRPDLVQRIKDWRRLVELHDHILGHNPQPLRIRIGAGITACSSVLPAIVRKYLSTDRPDKINLGVDFVYARTRELEERAKRGDVDLAIVFRDAGQQGAAGLVKEFKFPLALICHKEHRLAKLDAVFTWKDLDGETVALFEEEGAGTFQYPESLKRSGCRMLPVGNFLLAHSLVMAEAAVTISVPQLLTPEQRQHVRVISLPERDQAVCHICVVRPKNVVMPRTDKERKMVDELEAAIVNRFSDDLNRTPLPAGRLQLMDAWHVSQHPGRPTWIRGRLTGRHWGDARFDGKYEVFYGKRRPTYLVTGDIADSGAGNYQITMTAVREKRDTEEEFLANYVCDASALRDGPICGAWMGRNYRPKKELPYEVSLGYSVLLKPGTVVTADSLNAIASKAKIPPLEHGQVCHDPAGE
jgi:DNA-binding transcriptional LysR family regulator